MYNSLGTCDLLVRMLRSWGKIQINQHRPRSRCTREAVGAIVSLTLTFRGDTRTCAHAYAHIQRYRGIYTNLGTCDLLVRIRRIWVKIQVNQHRLRSMCTREAEAAIPFPNLTRRGGMRKCAHAYAHIQTDVH